MRKPYVRDQSLDLLGKTKTYQQTKSLECEASLISLKELAEKRKKGGEVPDEKVNCK